jgi:hypothetical protein
VAMMPTIAIPFSGKLTPVIIPHLFGGNKRRH